MPNGLASLYQEAESIAFKDRALTIYMPHTHDMLDYVLYRSGCPGPLEVVVDAQQQPRTVEGAMSILQPVALMQCPGERDIISQSEKEAAKNVKYRQLPIPSFPSDHIPLLGKFQLTTSW